MNIEIVIALLVISMIGLLLAGIPVAFALLTSSVIAFAAGAGVHGLQFLATIFWDRTFTFDFLSAPMFIYMGFLLQQSGMVSALFRAINIWLGRVPGSLGVVAIASSTVFATMCGSGSAAAAALGSIMMPEARKYRFNSRLMLGALNGGSCLAPLIPPSVAFIVYSTLTNLPITRLFAAGLVPGLMMSVLMMSYIVIIAYFKPHLAPRPARKPGWEERLSSLWVFPVFGALVFVVLGGIYLGWYTPSEFAAIGIVFSLVLLCVFRRFNPRVIWTALFKGSREAVVISVFIMLLVVCGSSFSNVLNFLGLPQLLSEKMQVEGFSQLGFVAVLSAILFLMGTFIDAITIQVLTVPFAYPILQALHIDPLWFGVFLVFWIEIGTFHPPCGLHLFVLQGATNSSYKDAVYGSLPFIPIWMFGIVIIYLYPGLVLWLPGKLF